MLRTVGRYMGKIKRMSAEFQGQFQEALREAELTDLKKHADDLKSTVTDFTQFRSAGRHEARRRSTPCRTRRAEAVAAAAAVDTAAPRDACVRAADAGLPAIDVPLPEPLPPVTNADFAPAEPPLAEPRSGRAARPPRRRSGPGTPHDARGHRGHQGPADGAPDRAALAADQGAARLRRDVRALLRLRQGHLQRPGLALRLGGGAGELQIHLHGAARIFHHAAQAGDVRRGLPVVPDRRGADLHVRRARPLPQRAQGVPAVSDRDADLLRARRDGRLFPRPADAGALLAAHAAAGHGERKPRSR